MKQFIDQEKNLTIFVERNGDNSILLIKGQKKIIEYIIGRLSIYEAHYRMVGYGFSFDADVSDAGAIKSAKILCHIDEAVWFLSEMKLINPYVAKQIRLYINFGVVKEDKQPIAPLGSILTDSISQVLRLRQKPIGEREAVPLITSDHSSELVLPVYTP